MIRHHLVCSRSNFRHVVSAFVRMNKLEHRWVIKYLFLQGNKPSQTKTKIDVVYGDSSLSSTAVTIRGTDFICQVTSLKDETLPERLRTETTYDNIEKIQ